MMYNKSNIDSLMQHTFYRGVTMKSKKVLSVFIGCTIFIIFLFMMIDSASQIKLSTSTQNTKFSPTIIIDAGHGGEDGGAVSDNGILEKDINLVISNNTADFLTICGFDTKKTRTDDSSLSNDEESIRLRKVADMKKRLEIFNSSDNNIIISIHQNKFTESKYYGTQIFYSPNSDGSKKLAENIKFTIKSLLQPQNERECKKAGNDIYLLKNSNNPAVIVECGFLSNPSECQNLTDPIYQKQMAFSIVTGFLDYHNKN